jgi:hypothetical protein
MKPAVAFYHNECHIMKSSAKLFAPCKHYQSPLFSIPTKTQLAQISGTITSKIALDSSNPKTVKEGQI